MNNFFVFLNNNNMKKEYLNLLIILLIFLVSIYIIKILKVTGICFMILSILSPLFFGYIISWILRPIVDKIKFNRVVTTIFIYLIFIGFLVIILFNLLLLIIKEIKNIFFLIKYYINNNKILYKIYESLNLNNLIKSSLKGLNKSINNIFNVSINIVYILIFCFYFLIKKNSVNYFKFIPKKLRNIINKDLRLYVKSIVLDTLFMFIILSISFSIIGLESPLIFSLFCSLTNIIPYLGPYIGGVPAVLLGLSNSLNKGIIVLVTIILVQTIENNIIQPLIVSKNVNLNPIYILIGIIVFSHFWGIIGMIISTPVLLIARDIFKYIKKTKPKWLSLALDKL